MSLRVSSRVVTAVAFITVISLVASTAIFLWLRHAVNDSHVPQASDLVPAGAPRRVMAVWAHPDDEVTSAGTLAQLVRQGVQVSIVYYTHGEAAHHTGYSREQLWRMRPQEAAEAGRAIGARSVTVLDYGDGELVGAPGERAKTELRRLVAVQRPSVLISFDGRVGYYGHADHAQVGRWVADVVRAGSPDPTFPVRRLYQATLPASVISLARRHIAAFRDHYPPPPAPGLPAPTVAVPIARQASIKRAVLDAHRTQIRVIDDVQPFGRKLPAWLYYRLLDREYFAQVVP